MVNRQRQNVNIARAVILTALPVEYEAVAAHLTNRCERTHPHGTVYEVGEFLSEKIPWEVLIAEIGAGNQAAALEAERAIAFFNPSVAFFVGVAGGLKDVQLGDVVAATDIYGYESGKANSTLVPRLKIGSSTYPMVQRARAIARKSDWPQKIDPSPTGRKPQAFVGPIAAGEKVVASKRSSIYKFLKQNCGDALAVEMEGRGFLEATHANTSVNSLVIRGISDLVSGKTRSDAAGYQEVAAEHAAAFAFEMLANLRTGDDTGTVARVQKVQVQSPDALPPIWNVPHNRNRNFTGREDLLAELRAKLCSCEPAAITQAISGLGGVGKTQLALEYVYRHASDYQLVWWVRSEEPAALAGDYAALAAPLGLPTFPEQEKTVQAVRDWLGRNTGWLIVFDNARNPEKVQPYIPQGRCGHTIITSRNQAWSVVGGTLPIKKMTREESVEFLFKRTSQKDRNAAESLAEELGDFPLALEQAGAYIEATGKTFADYVSIFKNRRKELLKKYKPLNYPDSVATTWKLSFENVKKKSAAAQDLLILCSFLAPDNIRLDIITDGAEHLPARLASVVKDTIKLDEARSALRLYSLVDASGNTLSVHRLVQAVTQDNLSGKAKRKWSKAAVKIVNKAFPFDSDDVRTWPICSKLLSHALAATACAEQLDAAAEATSRLLNQVGGYLLGRAEFLEARSAHERALTIAEKAYGPEHPNVAIRLSNLGTVLHGAGDLKGAKERIERALTIAEKAYGPEHPTVGTLLSNLGTVLAELGDLKGAKERIERALTIAEKAYGPEHPNVAIRLSNLGTVLHGAGDLKGAKERIERALMIDEKAFAPEHRDVARLRNNLGLVLQDLGDLAGAKKNFERALKICEKCLGKKHPKTVTVRKNLESLRLLEAEISKKKKRGS
jgi:nucleoside phosphorylase/tetratricopeptide (TPR) repeat protein